MAWRQLVLRLGALDPDTVEAVCLQYGASSVTLSDAADNPVLEPGPGETPLWADTLLTALLPADVDLEPLKTGLLQTLGLDELPEHRIEILEERAWEREWLKDFGPMQFGERLFVLPQGSAPPSDDCTVVYLDPGLAFGTGTHATTALCLEYLDGLPLDDKTFLDYGCGSGILAIAALRLGCESAVAMDIDPQAVLATRQNAADNGVDHAISVLATAAEITGTFDVVVANILAGPLIQFADFITSRISGSGMLALSGVLCEQADEVMAAYAPWIEFEEPVFREQDGQVWSRLAGKRRAG